MVAAVSVTSSASVVARSENTSFEVMITDLRSTPRTIYDRLGGHGKRLARFIVADSGGLLDTGYLDDIDGSPLRSSTRWRDQPVFNACW